MIIMGALSMVTGVWLWGAKFPGIGVGISLLIIGVIIDAIVIIFGRDIVSYEIGMTFLTVNAIMLILAAWGWSTINHANSFELEGPSL